MSATLTESGGRQRLTIERALEHPIDRVWRSVIEPEQLSVWHPATVTALDPWVGGVATFDYGDGITTTADVVEYEPHRVLAFMEASPSEMTRESDSLTRIELLMASTVCILRFIHEFDDRAAAASYATGWSGCLDMLATALGGEQPAGHVTDLALYDRFIREFGLDEPVLASDGIRIERQLMLRDKSELWDLVAPHGTIALDAIVPTSVGPVSVGQSIDGESIDIGATDGSRIHWSLGGGPGGARIQVTHDGLRGRDATEIERLGRAWRATIDSLASRRGNEPDAG